MSKGLLIAAAVLVSAPFMYGELRAYITPMEFKEVYGEEILNTAMEEDEEEQETAVATTNQPSTTTQYSNQGGSTWSPTTYTPRIYIPTYIPAAQTVGSAYIEAEEHTAASEEDIPAPEVPINTAPSPQWNAESMPTSPVYIPQPQQIVQEPSPPQQNVISPQTVSTYQPTPSTTPEVLSAFQQAAGGAPPTPQPLAQNSFQQWQQPVQQALPYQAPATPLPQTPPPQTQQNVYQPPYALNVAWPQHYVQQGYPTVLQSPAQYAYLTAPSISMPLPASGPGVIAVLLGCLGGSTGLRLSQKKFSSKKTL